MIAFPLASWKRIAVVAVWFFVPTVRSFAQITLPPVPFEVLIVGGINPDGAGIGPDFAQAFSLSSPAYVTRVDLVLVGTGKNGGTCTFTIAITNSLGPHGSLGEVFLMRSESVLVPPFDQHPIENIPFSDEFPGVFLPAGSYYLVWDGLAGPRPCALEKTENTALWGINTTGSHEVGIVGQVFTPDSGGWSSLCGCGQIFSFDLVGPLIVPPPFGGGPGEIARLVVEGPVTPPPGGPVEAQLGFVDMNGNSIGPTSTVTLNPGEIQSLDLNLGEFATQLGQRIEVRPAITQVPGVAGALSPPAQFSGSMQILDALTGFGTVLSPLLQPSAPVLSPQALASGETMRLNVVAVAPSSCSGQLSFAGKDGGPVGPTLPVNLSPGTGTSLDLNSDTMGLRLGKVIEVQPILTVTPSPNGAAVSSVCQASVEVFGNVTGKTRSYQSSLAAVPAVQSPAVQ